MKNKLSILSLFCTILLLITSCIHTQKTSPSKGEQTVQIKEVEEVKPAPNVVAEKPKPAVHQARDHKGFVMHFRPVRAFSGSTGK